MESEIADGDRLAFVDLAEDGADGLTRRTEKLSKRYGFEECAED
jgi:hypothetical protein